VREAKHDEGDEGGEEEGKRRERGGVTEERE
jgi:hypothetical protein